MIVSLLIIIILIMLLGPDGFALLLLGLLKLAMWLVVIGTAIIGLVMIVASTP